MRHAISMVFAAFAALAPAAATAATASAPEITTQAQVDGDLTISVKMFEGEITGNEVPATLMDFGELADLGTGALRSQQSRLLLITTNSHRKPYQVTQVGSSLVSGTDRIPDGAFVVIPVCEASDAGNCAEGGLAPKGTAVGTKMLYNSGGTHGMAAIRAYYLITDDPAQGATAFVPADQPAGTYRGTLVITASA